MRWLKNAQDDGSLRLGWVDRASQGGRNFSEQEKATGRKAGGLKVMRLRRWLFLINNPVEYDGGNQADQAIIP